MVDCGDGDPWPDVGRAVGEAVAAGRADRGVVCCWTGTGVSMAANKVAGVRAALCTDAETARGRGAGTTPCSRSGSGSPPGTVADEVVDAFLATDVDPSERDLIDRLS